MGLGEMFGKLFSGGKSGGAGSANEADPVEYNGFTIVASPLKEGSQFKTAGTISRQIDDELKTVQFIRADNHADMASAVTHAQSKARQIIDEQGDRIFQREHV